MPANYEFLASFSQLGGLFMFMIGFGCVLIYALGPSRKNKFDVAAHMPLQED